MRRLGRPDSRFTEDHLMRIVVATANNAAEKLCRAAGAYHGNSPAVAAHIRKLAQAIAGMTLDTLRTWPTDSE